MEENIFVHGLLCGLVCAVVHEVIDLLKRWIKSKGGKDGFSLKIRRGRKD